LTFCEKRRKIKDGAQSSPPYEGGVAAAPADGVVLAMSAKRECNVLLER
jgi:hypothetical protein